MVRPRQTTTAILFLVFSVVGFLRAAPEPPGTVVGWGRLQPGIITNAIAIASGNQDFGIALTREGKAVSWQVSFGRHPYVQYQSGNTNVIAITAFDEEGTESPGPYVLLLRKDGTVAGMNRSGTGIDYIPGFTNVVAVTPGYLLRGDGSVISAYSAFPNWSAGPNKNVNARVPAGLTNIVGVYGEGSRGATVLKADGTVFPWNMTIPQGLSNVVAVSRNDPWRRYQLLVKQDGTMVVNTTNYFQQQPPQTNDIAAVSVGSSHSMALKIDGGVLQWGNMPTPVPANVTNAVAVAAGPTESYALIDSGLPPWVMLTSKITTRLNQNAVMVANVSGRYPLTYQWQFNGTNVPGATNAFFLIEHTQDSDIGVYTVAVGNSLGTNVSNGTTLFIDKAPLITTQPLTQEVAIGQPLEFSVTVESPLALTYQWQFGGVDIAGATNSSYVITTALATNTGQYRVVVANNAYTNISSAAKVWVNPPTPPVRWVRGANQCQAYALATDAYDNVYVTGYFVGSATFGPHQLTAFKTNSSDVFLAKYDAAGNVLWAWQAGITNYGAGTEIVCAKDGTVYLGGYFAGEATMGTNVLVETGDWERADMFVARFDAAGNVLWAQSGGSLYDDDWNGIAVDEDGNCFVTGDIYDTAYFGTNVLSGNSQRIFLAKYTADGALAWIQQFLGGPRSDQGGFAAVDKAGNCYITGQLENTNVNFGNLTFSNANYTPIFAKFNPDGQALWVKRLGVSHLGFNQVYMNAPMFDDGGNIYLAGEFAWSINFGNGIILTNASTTSHGSPYDDAFVAKHDSDGNFLWARQSFGGSIDTCSAAIDGDGNVYLNGIQDLSSISGVVTFGATTRQCGGTYFAKCDANGNFTWAKRMASGNGVDIAVTKKGVAYVTGSNTNLITRIDPDEPILDLSTDPQGVSLSWLQSEFAPVLETSTNLVANSWEPVAALPSVTNNNLRLSEPIAESKRFYRLRAP